MNGAMKADPWPDTDAATSITTSRLPYATSSASGVMHLRRGSPKICSRSKLSIDIRETFLELHACLHTSYIREPVVATLIEFDLTKNDMALSGVYTFCTAVVVALSCHYSNGHCQPCC